MSSSLPPELKPLKRFFKRAEELDRAAAKGSAKSASIAYFCRSYALQLGLKIHRDLGDAAPPTIMAFLLSTMDSVEAAKAKLPKYDGEAAKAFCQQFALSVFKRADDEDRNGLADKGTARTFYAAATFLDMLLQFGDLDENIKDLPLYAKYKANDIVKALKEGRQPTPGPPGGDSSQAAGGGEGSNEVAPSNALPATGGGGAATPSASTTTDFNDSTKNAITSNQPSSKPDSLPPPTQDPPAPSHKPNHIGTVAPNQAPSSAPRPASSTNDQVGDARRRSSSGASEAAEDAGSNIALDMAIEMVKTAIQADHAQDYIKAFRLYKECLGYFMDAIKISKNKTTKATIMSRMEAYMKRAEQLKPIVKKLEAANKK